MKAPAPIASVALVVGLGTVALAAVGFASRELELLAPVTAQAALIISLGGTILGGTLAAIGLMFTQHRADPVGRRRAWTGAALCALLLVVLVIDQARDIALPFVGAG